MVAKDYDAQFCSNGKEVCILLHREDAHRWDGAWGSFLAEGSIFAKGDLLLGAHALDGILFPVVAVKPDFAVRIVIS